MFGEYDAKKMGRHLVNLRGKMPRTESAKRSEISNSYLRSLEIGQHPTTGKPIKASPETLVKLAKTYEIDPNDLLIRANYVSSQLYLDFDEDGLLKKELKFLTVEESKNEYDYQKKLKENDIVNLILKNELLSYEGRLLDFNEKYKIIDMLPILLRDSHDNKLIDAEW